MIGIIRIIRVLETLCESRWLLHVAAAGAAGASGSLQGPAAAGADGASGSLQGLAKSQERGSAICLRHAIGSQKARRIIWAEQAHALPIA